MVVLTNLHEKILVERKKSPNFEVLYTKISYRHKIDVN